MALFFPGTARPAAYGIRGHSRLTPAGSRPRLLQKFLWLNHNLNRLVAGSRPRHPKLPKCSPRRKRCALTCHPNLRPRRPSRYRRHLPPEACARRRRLPPARHRPLQRVRLPHQPQLRPHPVPQPRPRRWHPVRRQHHAPSFRESPAWTRGWRLPRWSCPSASWCDWFLL